MAEDDSLDGSHSRFKATAKLGEFLEARFPKSF
jgi:hypothetical protein